MPAFDAAGSAGRTKLDPKGLSEILDRHARFLSGGLRGKRADLSCHDLSNLDFSSHDLSLADLSGASLRSTQLANAQLRQADLLAADVRFANLDGANLSYADLRGPASAARSSTARALRMPISGKRPCRATTSARRSSPRTLPAPERI